MKKTSVLLLGLSFTLLFNEAHPATITFTNNCAYAVWPATLTGGSRPQLSSTGFQLATKETQSLDVPAPFTGRFWGRTHCTTNSSSGKFICATGDCGSGQLSCNGAGGNPPISLIEFTLAENNGQDFYDVSLVDGFNVPISVSPQGGSGNNCTSSSCAADVNSVCPTELAVKGSDGGTIIACKSACEEFNQPEYCCTGNFETPVTCKPSSYSMIFKDQCPQAYSYAYDDLTSTFSCSGGANYAVIFCP